jgi:hypothetical protein
MSLSVMAMAPSLSTGTAVPSWAAVTVLALVVSVGELSRAMPTAPPLDSALSTVLTSMNSLGSPPVKEPS